MYSFLVITEQTQEGCWCRIIVVGSENLNNVNMSNKKYDCYILAGWLAVLKINVQMLSSFIITFQITVNTHSFGSNNIAS